MEQHELSALFQGKDLGTGMMGQYIRQLETQVVQLMQVRGEAIQLLKAHQRMLQRLVGGFSGDRETTAWLQDMIRETDGWLAILFQGEDLGTGMMGQYIRQLETQVGQLREQQNRLLRKAYRVLLDGDQEDGETWSAAYADLDMIRLELERENLQLKRDLEEMKQTTDASTEREVRGSAG